MKCKDDVFFLYLDELVQMREGALNWEDVEDRKPAYALVEGVDLVVIRYDDEVSVLYGRCAHRGALMADGHVDEREMKFASAGGNTCRWDVSLFP